MPSTLVSRLPEIAAALQPAVKAADRAAAELVAAAAQVRCPVGTPPDDSHPGRLKASIHVEADEPPFTRAFFVVADAQGDNGVPYGHMVENGTVRAAPHPFMTPAAELIRATHAKLVAAAIKAVA